MKPASFPAVGELLPHDAPMILIDSVIESGEMHVVCRVDHDKDSVLSDDQQRVPVWAGIEYMAQSISALAGLRSKAASSPICVGYLLGTRHYQGFVSHFPPQQPVFVTVRQVMAEEGMPSLFDCQITDQQQKLLATAEIKAIQSEETAIKPQMEYEL